MKCTTCSNYVDEARNSVVCPHPLLDLPPNPQGGPRIPGEAHTAIDEAFRTQDRMALMRLMGHGNPLVRMYARDMTELLDMNTAQGFF